MSSPSPVAEEALTDRSLSINKRRTLDQWWCITISDERMRKLHRCSTTKSLPHHVVEHILERLQSLLRFKCVSNQWKSTVESKWFQKRHLVFHSDDPQVLLLYPSCVDVLVDADRNAQVLDSPVITSFKITTESTFLSQTTCDGLVCAYGLYSPGIVANPTTRWTRSFPPSMFQQLILDLKDRFFELAYPFPLLGFGKDTCLDTYKLVSLYNSSELGLDNVTTCEVFDFTSNAWRYVVPSSPLRVIAHIEPLYFDGSLHWFTEGTKVLSFHLHTETFQVLSEEAPFVVDDRDDIAMCSLNDRFCVTQKKRPDQVQLIWSFDSSNNTWVKLYTIDLNITSSWFGIHRFPLSALALPVRTVEKKTKLLLYDREYYEHKQRLVLHDPQTKSYDLLLSAKYVGLPLYYFQSLFSVL